MIDAGRKRRRLTIKCVCVITRKRLRQKEASLRRRIHFGTFSEVFQSSVALHTVRVLARTVCPLFRPQAVFPCNVGRYGSFDTTVLLSRHGYRLHMQKISVVLEFDKITAKILSPHL